jgi:hypothetical protein
MSIYYSYSPELVKALMNERNREVREESILHCCTALEADEPERSIQDRLLSIFHRQSPAACAAEC